MGGIFSRPKTPSIPEPTPIAPAEPIPDTTLQDPVAKSVREDEEKKLRAKKGGAANVLTSPIGLAGTESGSGNFGNSLLGKVVK